jgi:acyl-homoserine lactone acylase PvdQ
VLGSSRRGAAGRAHLARSIGAAVLGLATSVPAVVGPASPSSASPRRLQPPGSYRENDSSGGRTIYVLPPGENGLVSAADYAAYATNGTRPPGSDDQLPIYANLLYGYGSLTDATLGNYFEDESFGIPRDQVTRIEHPSPQVTILRDEHEVPHVYGSSMGSMAFGAGYAAGEDRLFFMDVLRHYAEGDLAGFLGPSCQYEQMDHDQLLVAGYTRAQLRGELDSLPRRFGDLGRRTLSMIESYVAGVNAYIAAARSDPAKMPIEYAATPNGAQPWSAVDVAAITSLITTQATGGGSEVANAEVERYLSQQLGPRSAPAAFADFKEQNDPAAPTTITDRSFPYMIPKRVDQRLTAIPDDPAAPLGGGPTDTTPGCTGGASPGSSGPSLGGRAAVPPALSARVASEVAADLLALGSLRGQDSNAIVLDAAHSEGGHPIAVFGPELGYYSPEVLMVEDLHAPGYDAEGAAFPGTNLVVQIGRGRDYAWSATTASTDQVDQRVELVCDPRGRAPAPEGLYYLYRGRCLPMGTEVFSEALPSASGPLPAGYRLSHRIHTTVHGIVQGWTTVGGRPVAVVNQRSTFLHDVDSLVGFLRWGEPALASTPQSWMAGADDIPYSFNWFYVGTHDIAYVVSGRDPVRPGDVDPNLPTWGTGGVEWKGFLPPGAHPHEVDPRQGYFTSWNNKPAPLFSASDDTYGWGPLFRSQMLDMQLRSELARHRRLTRAEVVQAAEAAATMDLSGLEVVPSLAAFLGPVKDPEAAALLAQLEPWSLEGAHRMKPGPSASQYIDAPAVAIWDEAYPRVIEALFSPIFGAGGVRTYGGLPSGYDVVKMVFEDTPNDMGAHDGDGYYGGWDGYVTKALSQLQGGRVAQPFSPAVESRLCGAPSRCRTALLSALDQTYSSMVAANGGSHDVADWTQNTATASAAAQAGAPVTMPQYDQIEFQAVGILGQPPIDWQNRPTFQQIAQFAR